MIYLEFVSPPVNSPTHIAKFHLAASVAYVAWAGRLLDFVTIFVIYLFKTLFINTKVLKYLFNLETYALSSFLLQV